MNDKISVLGCGFIGRRFCELYPADTIPIPSGDNQLQSKNLLYLRSTTSNYTSLEENIQVNLVMLAEFLKNLKPENKLVFVSSWFVYGQMETWTTPYPLTYDILEINCQLLPTTEGTNNRVLGNYGITKLAAEQIVETFCKINKIPYLILRLSNIVGAADKWSAQKNALQFIVDKLKKNEPVELYNGGEFFRSVLHVDEAARAIKFLIENEKTNEIYNVGPSETNWNFKQIVNYCADKLNSQSQITSCEPSEFHKIVQVKNFKIDTTKLKNLGFKWKMSLTETLDSLL